MTVSLELLGRGPSRPDLLDDLVVDEASIVSALARWSAPAPVEVEPSAATGLPAGRVLAACTELELYGGAQALPGRRYTAR